MSMLKRMSTGLGISQRDLNPGGSEDAKRKGSLFSTLRRQNTSSKLVAPKHVSTIDWNSHKNSHKSGKMLSQDTTAVILETPLPVINTALELTLVDDETLMNFLQDSETQTYLKRINDDSLVASLEASVQKRASPTSVRYLMLWRLANALLRLHAGDRGLNLRLSLEAFDILTDICEEDAEVKKEHYFHYQALLHSRALATQLYEEHRFSKKSILANDLTIFGDSAVKDWDAIDDIDNLTESEEEEEKKQQDNAFNIDYGDLDAGI